MSHSFPACVKIVAITGPKSTSNHRGRPCVALHREIRQPTVEAVSVGASALFRTHRQTQDAAAAARRRRRRAGSKFRLPPNPCVLQLGERSRIWWNWQTRYFEVVVPQGVQVQVLLSAPVFLRKMGIRALLTEPGHKNRPNSTAEN